MDNLNNQEIDSEAQIKTHKDLWQEIIDETENIRKDVDTYRLSQKNNLLPPPHPVVEYLNELVFPTLNLGLMQMLQKVKEQENEIFTEGDTYFNCLDFLAEYLWNMNSNHPERKLNWKKIADILW